MFYSKKNFSTQKLAKTINDYLSSQIVTNNIQKFFTKKLFLEENSIKHSFTCIQIRV